MTSHQAPSTPDPNAELPELPETFDLPDLTAPLDLPELDLRGCVPSQGMPVKEDGCMSAELIPAASFPVVSKPHPFAETVFAQFPHGMSIAEAMGDAASTTAEVTVGGISVPRAYWDKVKPRVGVPVEITLYPQGGNAGKAIRIVAMVAVAYLSYGVASGALGASFFGSYAGVAGAAIGIVGSMAINALIPPPTPKGLGSSGDPFQQLNSLTGTSNQANPYGVIPCVVGSTRFMGIALPALNPGDDLMVKGRRFWRPVPIPGQVPRDMAIHEAGHAIAAWWCGQGVECVHTGDDGGFTTNAGAYIEGDDETAVRAFCKGLTRKQLNDRVLRELVFAMAGPMAEARLKGYGLAWQVMAMDPGYWQWQEGEPPSDLHCWVALSRLPKPKDCKRVANGSVSVTAAVLALYWPQVEALADALQERRTLTGAEVLEVIGEQHRERLAPLSLGKAEVTA